MNRRATMSDLPSIKMEQSTHVTSNHKTGRRSSIGEGEELQLKRTPLTHRNSWPTNHNESVSPRGPMKSHLGRMKDELQEVAEDPSASRQEESYDGFPEPARQRHMISTLDAECTCTYAVSKLWYAKWEEYVGVPKGSEPGQADSPGPIEMDTHNDGNNEYLNEEAWRRFVKWYGVSPSHQLDRKHLYFKDEKMFDVCILSPFSGIVEHNVKKFNRFEEIGYIECQLRRIFHVAEYRKSRLWISEKAQVPRFRQLLLRFRMLNDCIHRDKVYILALEECNGSDAWPTGEPGDPKGDLAKYKDLISGPITDEFWTKELTDSLTTLQLNISDTVKRTVESFLQNSKALMGDKEAALDHSRTLLETKLDETKSKEARLADQETDLNQKQQTAAEDRQSLDLDRAEFEEKKAKFQDELTNMESLHRIQETKIKLDVGGQTFTTSIQTLRRDEGSMLAAMFSGRYELKKEPDGSYFIDRDGTYFRYVLNFLRDGYLDTGTLPHDNVVIKELHREAKYYQLTELVQYLEEMLQGEAGNHSLGNGK